MIDQIILHLFKIAKLSNKFQKFIYFDILINKIIIALSMRRGK